MRDWTEFKTLDEVNQAAFLLDIAEASLPSLADHPEKQVSITDYVATARAVLGGALERHAHLMRFLDDPFMEADFNTYFHDLEGDERACAALDLASYACGFVARVTAPAAGATGLPDPVRESLPDVAEYFRERAALLGV